MVRSRDILIVRSQSDSDFESCFERSGLRPVQLRDLTAAHAYLEAVKLREKPAPQAAIVDLALPISAGVADDDSAGLRVMETIRTLGLRPDVKVVPIMRRGSGQDAAAVYGTLLQDRHLAIVGWLVEPAAPDQVTRLANSLAPRRSVTSRLQFKQEIPLRARRILGTLAFVFPIALWWSLTRPGLVNPIFLPAPTTVVADIMHLFNAGFLADILASIWRVIAAFGLASALAIPVGTLMGSFAPIEAFVSPLCAFFRYIPASAFIPLIILWLGIDHLQKIAVIFMGVFFYLLVLIAATVSEVPKAFIEIAYTLGASRWQVLLRVVSPAALPGILENLRAMVGAAWTYLIVAELVAAQAGIGYRILMSERFLQTGQVVAAILIIGVIGVVTDFAFRTLIRYVSPWRE